MRFEVIAIILSVVILLFAVILAILILRLGEYREKITELEDERQYLEWIVIGKQRTIGYQGRRIENLKNQNRNLGDENSRLRAELNNE